VESDGLEAQQSAAIFTFCWSLAIYIERIKDSSVATFFLGGGGGQRRLITMAAPNRNYELQK